MEFIVFPSNWVVKRLGLLFNHYYFYGPIRIGELLQSVVRVYASGYALQTAQLAE